MAPLSDMATFGDTWLSHVTPFPGIAAFDAAPVSGMASSCVTPLFYAYHIHSVSS